MVHARMDTKETERIATSEEILAMRIHAHQVLKTIFMLLPLDVISFHFIIKRYFLLDIKKISLLLKVSSFVTSALE